MHAIVVVLAMFGCQPRGFHNEPSHSLGVPELDAAVADMRSSFKQLFDDKRTFLKDRLYSQWFCEERLAWGSKTEVPRNYVLDFGSDQPAYPTLEMQVSEKSESTRGHAAKLLGNLRELRSSSLFSKDVSYLCLYAEENKILCEGTVSKQGMNVLLPKNVKSVNSVAPGNSLAYSYVGCQRSRGLSSQ